ncbi:MAG: DUF1273 family protein [Clostridia bacterium]|nr:DUF1273 family protein [Clostridia bacterium]
MEQNKTVCFNGHRTNRLPKGEKLKKLEKDLNMEIRKAISNGFHTFLFGACFGFDLIAASQVLKLKKENEICLIAVVPFKGQENRWGENLRQKYKDTLTQCDEVIVMHEHYCPGCYFDRNKYMVDNSSLIICYYDGGNGGTAQTVGYAKTKIEILNLYRQSRAFFICRVKYNLSLKTDSVSSDNIRQGVTMRKFIIDTDTGSDDAVALIMAVLESDIDVLGITTIGGNIPLEQTTKNALQTVEECGAVIPVYPGASKPLMRELVTADNVHGADGMGDMGLIHPSRMPEKKRAVDFILETVAANPDEIELVALGPVTNIALAIMKDRKTMKKVKHIWSMGTSGFGPGNITPVAEFNVFVDAESYSVLLDSGIPITIAGFDLCLGDAALNPDDLAELSVSRLGKFIVDCNKTRLAYNENLTGVPYVDLPDAVAMAAAIWPDVVLETVTAHCYCCTKEVPSYGQVIICDISAPFSVKYDIPETFSTVVKKIDPERFKKRLKESIGMREELDGEKVYY